MSHSFTNTDDLLKMVIERMWLNANTRTQVHYVWLCERSLWYERAQVHKLFLFSCVSTSYTCYELESIKIATTKWVSVRLYKCVCEQRGWSKEKKDEKRTKIKTCTHSLTHTYLSFFLCLSLYYIFRYELITTIIMTAQEKWDNEQQKRVGEWVLLRQRGEKY